MGCGLLESEQPCVHLADGEVPQQGNPTQFCLDGEPEIQFLHNPDSPYVIENEPALRFQVTAADSLPHQYWLPTSIRVETDQGFDDEISLVPFACINLIEDSQEDFPFNVEWWSCNRVNINNEQTFSENQITEIEDEIDGRLLYSREFKTMSGSQYIFDLSQIGKPAISEAIERLKGLSYISDDVSHSPQFPTCWLSDEIPPPPCPPWYLFKTINITFESSENEDLIPVQKGGWVRATYTQPDGTNISTTFTIPEISQGQTEN